MHIKHLEVKYVRKRKRIRETWLAKSYVWPNENCLTWAYRISFCKFFFLYFVQFLYFLFSLKPSIAGWRSWKNQFANNLHPQDLWSAKLCNTKLRNEYKFFIYFLCLNDVNYTLQIFHNFLPTARWNNVINLL